MVTATQRRRAVEHLKSRRVSERRACRLAGFSRSAAWRPLQGRNDGRLRSGLKRLAAQYPKYGCPPLHDMLVIEGQVVNKKRTYRIYREEELQMRTKKRKKISRPRVPMLVSDAVSQRWSMDFVADQLANGRRFRVLKVVDFSISGQRVARELKRNSRKLPKTIVCDNGPEFTSKAMYFWAKKARAKLHFIQPGKPTQNAFVEIFNGKMREYCLDLHWFTSIEDARSTIDDWQHHYNHVRPHRSLGKKPPAVFAKEAA
jgi:putative transposase